MLGLKKTIKCTCEKKRVIACVTCTSATLWTIYLTLIDSATKEVRFSKAQGKKIYAKYMMKVIKLYAWKMTEEK